MRCACCDAELAQPIWNRMWQMWEYCPTCLEEIKGVFNDYVEDDPLVEVIPYADDLEMLIDIYD